MKAIYVNHCANSITHAGNEQLLYLFKRLKHLHLKCVRMKRAMERTKQ